MNEFVAVIEAYETAKLKQQACVLVTLVHVDGSSYRRAGARMLITQNGRMTGMISGGCLEGDAKRKALHSLYQKKNKLVTYNTNDEEDAFLGAQLGCNGIVHLLFEPIDYNDPYNPLEIIRTVIIEQQPAVIVTLFNLNKNEVQVGTKYLIDNTGVNIDFPYIYRHHLLQDVDSALDSGMNLFRHYICPDFTFHAFFQYCSPPLHLYIIGAGNDAQILSSFAKSIGWNVSVLDGRSSHANTHRFNMGCQVIVSKAKDVIQHVENSANSYVVLMTHNYQYDLVVLKQIIMLDKIPYIGMLGPKKKFNRMQVEFSQGELNKVIQKIHTPVGLDIGAENATEISISILSEIISVQKKAKPGHLKDKKNPIHDRNIDQFQSISLP